MSNSTGYQYGKEFQAKVPTLVKLVQCLLPKADFRFMTFLIAIILKKRCKHVSLVQQTISLVLFGNGTKKQVNTICKNFVHLETSLQVYKCLQPFMICMSASATITLIDNVSQNFDAEVLRWSDALKENLKVPRI